ncbi:MAG: SAM-dependent chlorinase/fluorinase [Blastochloris sp.]|nr:SAM-dependent chlorinase/fluorinase [Blastochloris sp.]
MNTLTFPWPRLLPLLALCFSLPVLFNACGKKRALQESPPLLVILSDYGNRDAYLARIKGDLLSLHPRLQLVDLSQDISFSSLAEAGYLVDKAARSFPPGTIFLGIMDPGLDPVSPPILIHTRENRYLIGPDNGLFTHLVDRELVQSAHSLNLEPSNPIPLQGNPMPQGKNPYVLAVDLLLRNTDPDQLGVKLKQINRLKLPSATSLGNKTTGQVLHVGRYGNIITNIRPDMIPEQAQGKLLKISFKTRTISAPFLNKAQDYPSDRIFCRINADGEFEMLSRVGSAAAQLGIKSGETLSIQH